MINSNKKSLASRARWQKIAPLQRSKLMRDLVAKRWLKTPPDERIAFSKKLIQAKQCKKIKK